MVIWIIWALLFLFLLSACSFALGLKVIWKGLLSVLAGISRQNTWPFSWFLHLVFVHGFETQQCNETDKSIRAMMWAFFLLCSRQVDSNIVKILRQRKLECMQWEGPDAKYKCKKVSDDYEEAATNWFIKCKHQFVHQIWLLFIWHVEQFQIISVTEYHCTS